MLYYIIKQNFICVLQTINGQWDHDLYQNGNVVLKRAGAALAAQASGPAKLIISNLDFGVNDQDIKVNLLNY
jgi:hypothetical protein